MRAVYMSDFSEVYKELDKKSKMDPQTVLALEAVLTALFQATQAQVHVITGRLKRSGRISSRIIRNQWRGEIRYGDLRMKVDYAEYERERGDAHDFMAPARALDAAFLAAVKTHGD